MEIEPQVDAIFDAAWAYDLAFAWDIEPEIDVLCRLAGIDARSEARLLIPACGTGRHALAFAQRGFLVEASDISPSMLGFARRERPHPQITYDIADMTRPLTTHDVACDAAFTLCNSLRYVVDHDAVVDHLAAVGERLRRGARYIAELGLNHRSAMLDRPRRWAAVYPDCRAVASWTLTSLAPPLGVERAEITIERLDGTVAGHFVAEQTQRIWTADALADVGRAAGLPLCGLFDTEGRVAPDPTRPGRYYAAFTA
jgi:SAM-dependent methyltransferase